MSEVTQQLAHVGPCVPAPGSDCTPESGGTDCWRSYFNLEPCLSEPFSETQVMPMLCTSIVSNFYPHCVVQWYWRKVGLMLRCSSLGMTENCDSWPPNSHQANMDNRNNPEHLQSSFIWRAHNFWTAEMSITENSISTSACSSTFAGQSTEARLGHFTAIVWINIFQCAQVSKSLNCWVLQNFNCIKCKKERDTLSN